MRWVQKPPVGTLIDGSHPLAQGLVALWALDEGSGLPVDRASQRLAVGNNAVWTGSPSGPALAFNGSSQWVNLGSSTPWLNITGPITLACSCAPTPGIGQQQLVDGHNVSANQGYVLMVGANGNNEIDYTVQNGSSTVVSSNAGAVDGYWHLFAVSQSSTATGGVAFYRDGMPWGTATQALYPGSYAGQRALGSRSDGGAKWLSGPMGWVAVWGRALSAWEHAALAANPWQIFRSPYDVTRLSAAMPASRVSYPRGSSILRPVQLPTADLYCYLD